MTRRPVMSDPFISHSLPIKDIENKAINATLFSITCRVGYIVKEGKDEDARFEVTYRTDDGRVIYNETLSSPNLTLTLNETMLVGHLGKTVKLIMTFSLINSYIVLYEIHL